MLKTLREEYSSFFGDLRSYVSCYGGMKRVALSPYTDAAIVLTFLCWRTWHSHGWYGTPLSVLPPLLGFTLAAYALLLGFGDEGFLKFLALTNAKPVVNAGDTPESVLTGVSAIFLHFIVVEVVALLLALVGSAIWGVRENEIAALCPLSSTEVVYAGICSFAFFLAVLLTLAAGLDIYHATGWFVKYNRARQEAAPNSDSPGT